MENITKKIIILLTSFVMACGGGGSASTSVSTTNTTAQTGSQSSPQSSSSGSASTSVSTTNTTAQTGSQSSPQSSSSGSASTSVSTTNTIINGVAIDGYLYKATVFLDVNKNGVYDIGEPSATTDAKGAFFLSANPNQISSSKVIVMAIAGTSIDQDTGTVTKSFTMMAPAGITNVVSPLTTLVVAKMDADNNLTLDAAKSSVQKDLNLQTVDVFQNFIALKATNPEYSKAHNVAVSIAEVLKTIETGPTPDIKISEKLASLLAKTTTQIIPKIEQIKNAKTPSDAVLIAPVITSLKVNAESTNLANGNSTVISLIATLSDETTKVITSGINWVVSNLSGGATGSVSADGLRFTSTAPGMIRLIASYLGLTDTLNISISPAEFVGIKIDSIQNQLYIPLGSSQQLNVTGTKTDGSSTAISSGVTWSSSSVSIASVDTSGRVIANTKGNVTIAATAGLFTSSVTVTVTDPEVQSITVSLPFFTSISNGFSAALTAIGNLSNQTNQVLTSVVDWVVKNITDTASAVITKAENSALLTITSAGIFEIVGKLQGMTSNTLKVSIVCDSGSSTTNPFASCAAGELGLPGAATYKLDSIFDASNGSSVTLTLMASDGSVADGVTWTISSIPIIAVNQSSVAPNKLTISLTNPQDYQTYSMLVTASRNGQAFTKTILFWPSFSYNTASTRLPLNHEHDGSAYRFGEHIAPINGSVDNRFYAFDSKGWVNRKITVDFPGWLNNGNINDAGYDLNGFSGYSNLYDGTRKRAYLFYPHKSEDKFVFMSIDEALLTGTYKVLDFGQTSGTYGRWASIFLGDSWFMARSVLTSLTGSSANYRKINVHIYKFDYEGNLVTSKIIETSNIPNFGYSQTSVGSSSTYLPTINLERHFGDILVSGFTGNFQKVAGVSLLNVSQLWIPIDAGTMTLKSPFWIQSDRFRRANYIEQPDLYLSVSEWGWDLNSSQNTAWQPNRNFYVNTGNLNYSSVNINEGWFSGILSSDYSIFNLTTYGSKALDTTSAAYDYTYSLSNSGRVRAYKGSTNPNTLRAFVGTTSTLYGLPELNAGTASCRLYGQLYGQFNFGSDCNKFESFYGMDSTKGPVVRQAPSAFNSLSVYGAENGSALNILSLGYSTDLSSWGASLDLDANFRHPGCTTDMEYTAPTITPASYVETTAVITVQTPALLNAPVVNATAGPLTITVTPYQSRAPILCSQYKISLDQTIIVGRASQIGNLPTVSPVLHSRYSRQLILAPSNGSYDSTNNLYSPNRDFNGTDTFKIRINDGSGTQDVTVVVKVL